MELKVLIILLYKFLILVLSLKQSLLLFKIINLNTLKARLLF
jgi:hypothetical protein